MPVTPFLLVRDYSCVLSKPIILSLLGYAVFESVKKLRPEFRGLPGEQIRALKQTDQPIFDVIERPYFAYATDTLPEVLKHEPWLLTVPELMIECNLSR